MSDMMQLDASAEEVFPTSFDSKDKTYTNHPHPLLKYFPQICLVF